MALSTYDKQYLSPEDQEKILNLQKAYTTASKAGDAAGKKSAAEAAENVRRAYGYSGGADGQQFETLPGHEGAGELQKAGEDLVKAYTGINDAYKAQAEASKADIEKQRQATLKQAYVGNMMDQKNVDQQMRASGITGGISESARVAMQNNYRTNRNNVDAAAIEAKKDVELSTQQAIAQNEVNRANAEYNADVTKAQFQNTAAANNRNIKLTEESNKLAKEQADINKYTTFIQNGLVDSTNSKQIAIALGVSEDSVKIAAEAARNGDTKSMALSLMSAGVYDDSFVKLFGGHFSAETLKAFANNNKKTVSSPSYTSESKRALLGEQVSLHEYALNSNFCEGYDESEYAQVAAQYDMDVDDFKTSIIVEKINDGKAETKDFDKLMELIEWQRILATTNYSPKDEQIQAIASTIGLNDWKVLRDELKKRG